MTLLANIKEKLKQVYLFLTMAIIPTAQALAADDGFNKANDSINKWAIGLGSLSVATVTLCVLWIGYNVLWDGKELKQMKNVIIGGILITGASGFGAYYMA